MSLDDLSTEAELLYFAKKYPADHEKVKLLEIAIVDIRDMKDKLFEMYNRMFVTKDGESPCIVQEIANIKKRQNRLAVVWSAIGGTIVFVLDKSFDLIRLIPK